jgi:hypothetical protein
MIPTFLILATSLLAADPPKPEPAPVVLTAADREPLHNAYRAVQTLEKALSDAKLAVNELPAKIAEKQKVVAAEVTKLQAKCELADDPVNLVACKPKEPTKK